MEIWVSEIILGRQAATYNSIFALEITMLKASRLYVSVGGGAGFSCSGTISVNGRIGHQRWGVDISHRNLYLLSDWSLERLLLYAVTFA